MQEITSGFVPVNGITMYYEIYGQGEIPLILIHGGGSTINSTFGTLLPLLLDYGQVIAIELQAHGRTGDRDAPESFEQDADDVAGLLRYLKIEKAHILGFSNGGTTTLQMAIRHSQLIHKIVAISAVSKREGMIPGFFDGMQHASLENMPEPLKLAYLDVNDNKTGLQTMFEKDKQRMINFEDIDDEQISSIDAATLLMVADKDVITIEHTLSMSRLIKKSSMVVLPGVHGAFIGEVCTKSTESNLPEVSALLIKDFLKN